MLAQLLDDKRLFFICLIIVLIATTFWAGTRMPALSEKAAMGGDLVLEDPLGFEAVLPVDAADPVLKKIAYTTVNWINTNKQGMSFGLLFAAAFMTLLSLLNTRSFSGHFSNTLLGVVIGSPLGVCVNCAAPFARGLHASGARLETTLAAMISSPTLNIIVLIMLFTMLPLHMALIKLGLSLAFLLVGIPVLARVVFKNELVSRAILEPSPADPFGISAITPGNVEPGKLWGQALQWVVRSYARNLWYIVKITVPLMLLAGVLGAVVVTLFPWDRIAGFLPNAGGVVALLGMGTLALIGLFLPVPIAFDVVVVSALVAAGVPVKYSMVLLFTLGIFSVYSFLILWSGVSRRVATVLAGVLLVFGVLSGVAAHYYVKWNEPRQLALFLDNFSELDWKQRPRPVIPPGTDAAALTEALGRTAVAWKAVPSVSPTTITVRQTALQEPPKDSNPLFTRRYGEEFGLERIENTPVSFKFTPPFYRDWPIASGDVHGDGWVDVLLGTDLGLFLYANRGGKGFELQRVDIPELSGLGATNVVLVDLNNDRWLDIFVASYRGGNHVIYNDNGQFSREAYQRLPDTGANVASASAFGDLDRDGDLDIVLGNWTSGRWTRLPPEQSRNAILWNEGGQFQVERLRGLPGETLSTLISDINQDGYPDLMVGNDFVQSDAYYLGNPDGDLDLVTRAHGLFPHTTLSTMSIDSADINNDLVLEIYVGQVSGRASSKPTARADKLSLRPLDISCNEFKDGTWRRRCEDHVAQHRIIERGSRKQNPFLCLEIADPLDRGDCIAYQLLEKAARYDRNRDLCDRFPAQWEAFATICRLALQPVPEYPLEAVKQALPQIRGRNVFYMLDGDDRYVDRAEALEIDIAGWTWNAKFADLDNDEWQDLYVVNGQYRSRKRETNVFFHNEAGRVFREATSQTGLENYLSMGTYTYLDFDNDGDLDIITVSFDGPVWVYRNNTQSRRAIFFEFDDRIGNRFGIGNRLVIHYGPQAVRHQIREVKAGGGFLSVDAPQAHFGLGDYEHVSRVEVYWSTGERDELHGPFMAGRRYRIERPATGGG